MADSGKGPQPLRKYESPWKNLLPTLNPCPYLGSCLANCHFFRILEFSKPLTTDPGGVSCIQFHNLCLAVGWEEMGSFWNRAFWAEGSYHGNDNLKECLLQEAVDV